MDLQGEIHRKRSSSGAMDVGTPEEGSINQFLKIGERIFAVKNSAIYEIIQADDIDPQRTNINVPIMGQQLFLDHGLDSELVCRILLTADILLKSGFFDATIDREKILLLTVEMLKEFFLLEKEISDYLDIDNKVSSEYEEKRKVQHSPAIPSIPNVETRCKTIFQKINHIEQILMDIIVIFYPNEELTKQSHFPKFHEIITNKYGEQDAFSKFLQQIEFFMNLMYELRNSLDHRLRNVKVMDFTLQPDLTVISPTIELDKKGSELKRTSLSNLFPNILENLKQICETTIAFLCKKNLKPIIAGATVLQIPEEKRLNKNIRFAIWIPIGDDGYMQ